MNELSVLEILCRLAENRYDLLCSLTVQTRIALHRIPLSPPRLASPADSHDPLGRCERFALLRNGLGRCGSSSLSPQRAARSRHRQPLPVHALPLPFPKLHERAVVHQRWRAGEGERVRRLGGAVHLPRARAKKGPARVEGLCRAPSPRDDQLSGVLQRSESTRAAGADAAPNPATRAREGQRAAERGGERVPGGEVVRLAGRRHERNEAGQEGASGRRAACLLVHGTGRGENALRSHHRRRASCASLARW